MAEKLQAAGLEANLEGRIKRLYSIHQKLRRQRIDLDQVYDFVALRIVVPTIPDCYAALGVLHNLWRPVPGRIKDFIAMPRPNGYQSLHTSVIGDEGHPFEVQIRTREMHRIAEEGIAAHWKYKEGRSGPDKDDQAFAWLRQLLEWQQEVKDPHEFLNSLKLDLYPEEVYCFTPKGEVKTLPRGATPIDFAYAHPHRGRPPVRGRARERQDRAPALQAEERRHRRDPHLRRPQPEPRLAGPRRHQQGPLQDPPLPEHGGEAAGARHRQEALRARAQALRPLRAQGWRRRRRRPWPRSSGVGTKLDDLFAAIGYGKVSMRQVLAGSCPRRSWRRRPRPRSRRPITDAVKRLLRVGEERITVKGSGDLLIYRAKCCNPIMGEPIVGYITRGKGVSVHAQTCPNVVNLMYDPERRIAVEWERGGEGAYEVRIAVEVEDRPGLLAAITAVLAVHEHRHPHRGGQDLRRPHRVHRPHPAHPGPEAPGEGREVDPRRERRDRRGAADGGPVAAAARAAGLVTAPGLPTGGSDCMPKKHITSTDAPKPIGPYSQAVISGGLLFASGQIPLDPATGKLMEGDIEAQTEQVLKNLLAVLKEAKMGPENIVKTTVFLADMADFPKMNEVYERYPGQGAARPLDGAGRRPAQGREGRDRPDRRVLTASARPRLGTGSSRVNGSSLPGRRACVGYGRRLLARLGDLARAQAARAHLQPALDALHDGANPLQVRVEPPVGHVVGVADPVTGHAGPCRRRRNAEPSNLHLSTSQGALTHHPDGRSRPPLKPPSQSPPLRGAAVLSVGRGSARRNAIMAGVRLGQSRRARMSRCGASPVLYSPSWPHPSWECSRTMVQFNFTERTIKAKVVYYGPAQSGQDDEPGADPPAHRSRRPTTG